MDVTKVKINKTQLFGNTIYLSGTEFYVTPPYREGSSTVSRSHLHDLTGNHVASFEGYYFDYADKKLFTVVE